MEPLLNLTYEEHFKSHRPDGRFVSTFAAHMQWLRDLKPELALPEALTEESFAAWQQAVKEREDQRTDLVAVLIGIGTDDDLAPV